MFLPRSRGCRIQPRVSTLGLEFGHFKTVKPGENFRFFARQKFFVFLLASEFRSV